MSKMAIIAEALGKTYRNGASETVVLKGVTLQVASGELVAVVGPSGAGKTTLLYLLGGLAQPSSGRVVVGGSSLHDLDDGARSRARNQRIGFVFQSHHLLPELSACDNVGLPMRIAGSSAREARNEGRRLLAEVGLGHRSEHKPGELSGGEQQRVALARALVMRPEVILADEPTGNLDRANSEVVFEMLLQTTRQRGQAIVMVTHNDDLAARADRVVRMRDGQVV